MLLEMALASFQSLPCLFLVCEFGQRISIAYSTIDDVFGRFNWYLFPTEVQRILPIAILYVQQPVEIRFFGSFSCNREHFKNVNMNVEIYEHLCQVNTILIMLLFQVIKKAVSWFMVIRTFYE